MRKKVNLLVLIMMILSVFYSPVLNGYKIYEFKASQTSEEEVQAAKTVNVSDIHELDWSLLNVGDKLNIEVQDLNNFNDYQYIIKEWENVAKYSPENNSYTITAGEGTPQAAVEPKYVLDTSKEIYFGTTFDARSTRGFFGLYGYIQMITRPHYNYTHAHDNWSNAGSGENSWYASIDPDYANGIKLKYKEEGRFRVTKYMAKNNNWNTQTVHIDPANKYGEFMLCTLPEGNESYNCNNEAATNKVSIGYQIADKYLANQFVSIRFNPGTYLENSELEVFGMNTHAYIESFGEVTTSNKEVYVPINTSLEDAHIKADPRYNEFVENTVTAVGREIAFTDMIDDGGYNPSQLGTYTLTYEVQRGYDGGFNAEEEIDIHVVDPDQETILEAANTTYPITYAPTTKQELMERMRVSAYDPNYGTDVTDQVGISNYGGYDLANPRIGQYTITYFIKASNGNTVYKSAVLRIISPALSEELTVTQNIIDDEDGDLAVSPGENITFQVTVENTTGVDLDKPQIFYTVDDMYLQADTFNLLSGDVEQGTIEDNKITLEYDHIYKDQTLVFEYQIKAEDKWYIYTAGQDLTNLFNNFYIEAYGYDYQQELAAPLVDGTYTSFDNQFAAIDETGDGNIQPNEVVTTTNKFKNDSMYGLFDISIYITDGEKINSSATSTVVTSDMREITTADYTLEDNDTLFVYDVMPGETITVEQTFVANDIFETMNAVKLDSVNNVYGQDLTEVFSTETLTVDFGVNKDELYDVSVNASITDYLDGKINPAEEFEIKFIIENNGQVVLNNILVETDLSDLNINEKALSTDIVEITITDGDGQQSSTKIDIYDNKVKIESLRPGQKLQGYITLHATDYLDTDEFADDLLAAKLISGIKISDQTGEVFEKELTMPLNTKEAAKLQTTAEVVEVTGDGDGKVDPYETFEYKLSMTNTGKVDLNQMSIDMELNQNNGVTIDSYEVKIFDGEESVTDFEVIDDAIIINRFEPGHTLHAEILVNYSFPIYQDVTTNIFTIKQAFITDVLRQLNVSVDVEENQDIALTATASNTNVKPGETVHMIAKLENLGSTVEYDSYLTLVAENKNIKFDSISNVVVNGGALIEGEDYTTTGHGITINQFDAKSEIIIEFDIEIAKPMTIDVLAGASYVFDIGFVLKLENNKTASDNVEFTPNVSDAQYTTELSATTLTGGTAKTSDTIVYTYTITNGNDINLTNSKVKIDTSDYDLKRITGFEVSSTDETFEYSTNLLTKTVSFKNLGQNQTVTITAYGNTNDKFDSSETIDAKFDFTSDYVSTSDNVAVDKDLQFATKIETSNNLISTSSGNLLVGADEVITYQVRIDNVGTADISDLTISTEFTDNGNFETQALASLTYADGTAYDSANYTYDAANKELVIKDFKTSDVATIKFEIQTSEAIEYISEMLVTNTITSDYVNTSEQLALFIDTAHVGNLDIDYYLEEIDSDSDGKVDPGEINYIDVILTNTDFITLEDVYVFDTMNDPNLSDDFANVEVYNQDDELLVDGIDYIQSEDNIQLIGIPGNSSIRLRFKLEANETFTDADNTYISTMVRATFPTVGTIDTPFNITIPLDKPSNLDYEYTLDISNENGNDLVAPGDTLEVQTAITNTGVVDIKDLHVVFNNEPNLDYTTMQLDLASRPHASLDGMHVVIDQIPVGETLILSGTVKARDTFNSADKIEITSSITHQTIQKNASTSILIDASSADLKSSYSLVEVIGDGDNKIDPNERYDLVINLENTGKIELAMTELMNTFSSPNIKSIAYDGELSLVDGANVTVKSINAGEKQTLTYHIQFANVFNEDQFANIDFEINQAHIESQALNIEAPIDTENLTSLKSDLTVSDSSGNMLAANNEELTFTYTLTNDGARNLKNIVITSDLADKNLSKTPYDQVITIDGVAQTVNYNDTTKTYLIDELNVGQTLVLEYKVSTTGLISYNLINRIFNRTISSVVKVTTLDNSVKQSNLVRINIDPAVFELTAVAEIADQSGNGMLAANEVLTYDLTLTNNGAADLNMVTVRESQVSTNIVKITNFTVSSDVRGDLVAGVDYDNDGKIVILSKIAAGETLTLHYDLVNGPTSDMSGTTTLRSVVSSEYIESQTLNSTLVPDVSDRSISYQFTSVLDDEVTVEELENPSTNSLTIVNNGPTIEKNIKVAVNNISPFINLDSESLVVEKNGQLYEVQFDTKTGVITIPDFRAGDQITISIDSSFDTTIVSTDSSDTVDFNFDIDVIYAQAVTETLLSSGSIAKDLISQIRIFDILGAGTNLLADPGETIHGTLYVNNVGRLRQNQLEVTIDLDERNIDLDTFAIDSVTNNLNIPISSSNYQIDGNKITIFDMDRSENYKIKYSYTLNDVFDLGEDLNLVDLTIVDSVNSSNDLGHEFNTVGFVGINRHYSEVTPDGDLTDEDETGYVHPTEKLDAVYEFENTGAIIQYNLPIKAEAFTGNIEVEYFESISITMADELGNVRDLVEGVDYTLDMSTFTIYINQLNPGEKIMIDFNYITPAVMLNTDQIGAVMSAKPEINNKVSKALSIPVDYTSVKQMTVNSSLTREPVAADQTEQLTYTIDMVNDGEIEYMQLFNTIYLTESHADSIDTMEFSITKNGEAYTPENLEVYDAFIAFEILDVRIDDEFHIELKYTIDSSKVQSKSEITTMIDATGYANVLEDMVRLEMETISPEVEKEAPYVTGLEQVSIDEETLISDAMLLDIFEVNANVGAGRELTIDYNIDPNTPGEYPVTFTIEDTLTDAEPDTLNSVLTVTDIQPQITGLDKIVIDKTETIDDLMTEFNIEATEISSGDLTTAVSIDEAIEYGTVGTYDVLFTVFDNEGNKAIHEAEVEIINSIYPVLTGEDIIISSEDANAITSDLQILNSINAFARNYDGTNLTTDITVTDDHDFLVNNQNYSDGEQYQIDYQVTNAQGRVVTETSTITISNDANDKLYFTSNSPIIVKLDDNASLVDVTELAAPTAHVEGSVNADVKLDVTNIIETNYVANTVGLYMVKYQYATDNLDVNLRGTHNVLVFVTEDGIMPDNKFITIDEQVTTDIMPGDPIDYSIKITNDSFRTKVISNISASVISQNTGVISKLEVTDENGNSVDFDKAVTRSGNDVISNIAIPSEQSVYINVTLDTNKLFKYEQQIVSEIEYSFDGETRTSTHTTEIDQSSIDLSSTVEFDRDSYIEGQAGSVTVTINNNGTMDSQQLLLDVISELTNIEITSIYIDGEIVNASQLVTIGARSKVVIKINFKVLNNVVVGSDVITIFDDLDHEIAIEVPVDYTEVSINEEPSVESDSDQMTTDTTEESYQQMTLGETGKINYLLIALGTLGLLVMFRFIYKKVS